MNKILGIFLTLVFLALSTIASPAFAKKGGCTHRNPSGCTGYNQQDKVARDTKHQAHAYNEVLGYAQKPEVKEYLSYQDAQITDQWGQTRLILNCSDFLSPPLASGSTRLSNCF